MKTLLAILAVMIFAIPALATSTSKFSFRAYTSATPVDCGVKGSTTLVYGPGSHPYQGFAPDSAFDRTLTLGTKGMANYSTTLGGKKLGQVKFTCRVTATGAAARVKFFLNGVETHFLTLSDGDFVVQ